MTYLFLAISLLASAQAPSIDDPATTHNQRVKDELAASLNKVLSSRALEGAEVGLFVQRVSDGSILYSHQADQLLIPASTIKLFTSAAALTTLGPDYRFTTQLYGVPPKDGIIEGDIYLKGNGDPWLVPERVWSFLNRVYFQGIREITGDLVVDDSHFAGPPFAKGWEQDDSASAYMAPAGAVSIGFNSIQVHVLPNPESDQPATILIEPPSDYAEIEGTITTTSEGSTNLKIDVVDHKDGSKIVIGGQISEVSGPRTYWRRIHNPALHSGAVVLTQLSKLGIKVKGKVRTGTVPEDSHELVEFTSPRLADLLNKVNKYSNNFMASQLARAFGAQILEPPGSWEKGKKVLAQFLQDNVGILEPTYQIENASGLHDVNRVSVRQVGKLLTYMYEDPALRTEFLNSLAVAGGTGTLSERMQDTDASYLLRAKTGSLSVASALSGYVYAKNHEPVIFAMIVNHYKHGLEKVWETQNALGEILAKIDFATELPGKLHVREKPDPKKQAKR